MSVMTAKTRIPTVRSPPWRGIAIIVLALAVIAPFVFRWEAGQMIVLAALVVAIAIALLGAVGLLLVAGAIGAATRSRARAVPWARRIRWPSMSIVAALVALIVAVALSQRLAYTPPILGADGQPLPGSIATMEHVTLGGVNQWLVIRGNNVQNPVLLFLSGGPGGSELGRVRRFNQPLEERFVVVVWEQRGCGKSYDAINPKSALTVDQYVADIVELSDMLRTRFHADKIYLLGHSWGSIIGVRAVQQRPDLFYAYIGTGQMVNVRETDQIIYRMLLDHAQRNGNTQFTQQLTALGEPPYTGSNPIMQYREVLGREYGIFEEPYITSEQYKREGGLAGQTFIPEYGWLDRVNFMRGAMDTFNAVYPQLQDFDFRRDALHFDVPVYFFLGRHDVNATYWLAADYFTKLQAPHKRIEFFENSGHGNLWQEPDKFHALMRQVVAETYPVEAAR